MLTYGVALLTLLCLLEQHCNSWQAFHMILQSARATVEVCYQLLESRSAVFKLQPPAQQVVDGKQVTKQDY